MPIRINPTLYPSLRQRLAWPEPLVEEEEYIPERPPVIPPEVYGSEELEPPRTVREQLTEAPSVRPPRPRLHVPSEVAIRPLNPDEEQREAAYRLPIIGGLLRRMEVGREQELQIARNLPQRLQPFASLAPHEQLVRTIESFYPTPRSAQEEVAQAISDPINLLGAPGTSIGAKATIPLMGLAAGGVRNVGGKALTAALKRRVPELPSAAADMVTVYRGMGAQ